MSLLTYDPQGPSRCNCIRITTLLFTTQLYQGEEWNNEDHES